MPTDWTNVWQVYIRPPIGSSSIGELDKSWRREGDKILSYWETIFMKGSVELTDESKFTPMFVQALAARIAADAAIPFTENAKLQADMWSLYEGKLSAAAARDGQQGANDVIKQTLLIGSRYSDGIGER